jgi:hypothetical protein
MYYSSLIKAFLLSCLCISLSFAQTKGTTFTELPDPTADTLSDWSQVKPGLLSSFVTIDKRFPKSIAPEVTPTMERRTYFCTDFTLD